MSLEAFHTHHVQTLHLTFPLRAAPPRLPISMKKFFVSFFGLQTLRVMLCTNTPPPLTSY